MKYIVLLIILSSFTLQACEFNKSINIDLTSGISTKGNGIFCDDVYLSVNEKKTTNSSFIYGEIFYVNFNDIKGFKKENGYVFPGMKLAIVSSEGDTVMQRDDMYANSTKGFDVSPLLLTTNITVANPMFSNKKYKLYLNIWDKKGEGTFKTEIAFNIIPNKNIKIVSNDITYDNIYLFSRKSNTAITTNKVNLNEKINLIFEGLSGFKEENENISIGVSIIIRDANGDIILNEKDLMTKPIKAAQIKKQLAPNFTFSNGNIKNPTICEINIWDKKSDAKIKATFSLSFN